jgi:hypothetical protein
VANFYLDMAFTPPLTAAAERALPQRLRAFAGEHRVRWRDFLVDCEHRRIVCRVEAECLDAARAAARCAGVESSSAWWSAVAGAEPDPGFETHCTLVDVMAECRLDALRVQPGPVVTSDDGLRMRAFFRAPDAEAVRAAYRHAVVPFDRVVALRRIDPSVATPRRPAPPPARRARPPASS